MYSMLYFSFNKFRSLAKVTGSQDTYIKVLGFISNSFSITFLSSPLLGGSIIAVSYSFVISFGPN